MPSRNKILIRDKIYAKAKPMNEATEKNWSLQTEDFDLQLMDIGDGQNGDFDPQEDKSALLRLDVWSRQEKRLYMSIVTNLDIDAPDAARQSLLETMASQVSHRPTQNIPSL